jgi:hypothetical protein
LAGQGEQTGLHILCFSLVNWLAIHSDYIQSPNCVRFEVVSPCIIQGYLTKGLLEVIDF